jgi:hypothetical protein
MFLEQSPNAANYFFDTAKKKLLAYGSETSGKIYYLTELTRGINVFQKIIELNPTNLEKKVYILIIALDESRPTVYHGYDIYSTIFLSISLI